MKRPSFQFYPGDWKKNAKLRRCSEAARGAWVDILCLLHDTDEYGVCRWPLVDLARAAGVTIKLAKELVSKDVLKGSDKEITGYVFVPRHAGKNGEPVVLVPAQPGPVWYCSRFVRDEYIRQRRGQGTRFGDDDSGVDDDQKAKPKTPPKGGIGDGKGDGPSSSSSTSLKTKAPKPPGGGLALVEPKTPTTTLQTFLDGCRDRNERPIREYHSLWAYAEQAGLPQDFVALAWVEFCRRFMTGGTGSAKKYRDWRAAFRKYVEGNYLKLWAIDPKGEYFLTAQGKQAQKVHESKDAA
jgi:hypothetical protein